MTLICNEAISQFKIGPNAGIPLGDASDYYSLEAGIELGNVIELTAFVHGILESDFTYVAAGLGLLFEF